jgi:hypothetical protein
VHCRSLAAKHQLSSGTGGRKERERSSWCFIRRLERLQHGQGERLVVPSSWTSFATTKDSFLCVPNGKSESMNEARRPLFPNLSQHEPRR